MLTILVTLAVAVQLVTIAVVIVCCCASGTVFIIIT